MSLPDHPGNEPGWEGNEGSGGGFQCTAHKKTGERCKQRALRGLTVCRYHGGGRTGAQEVGLRRWEEHQAEQKALKALEKQGIQPLADPVDALYELAAEAVAWKNLATERRDELVEWRYKSGGDSEQLRAEIAIWERAAERAFKMLLEIEKLGLAERRTRVTEVQAAQVGTGVLAAVDEALDLIEQGTPIGAVRQGMPTLLRKHLLGDTAIAPSVS